MAKSRGDDDGEHHFNHRRGAGTESEPDPIVAPLDLSATGPRAGTVAIWAAEILGVALGTVKSRLYRSKNGCASGCASGTFPRHPSCGVLKARVAIAGCASVVQ
jgi:hypothetical protein